jgi:uncharacterized membrane protein
MIAEPTPPTALTPRAQAVADQIDRAVGWFTVHWLAIFVGYGALVVGLSSAAPLLRGEGYGTAARFIYIPYRLMCHQREDRSFHLHGEQMAFCERDAAIVSAAIITGLLFAVIRRWWNLPAIPFRVALLFALPMAIDGGTQLVGLRESTALLRVITGTLFSVGVGWFILPHLEAGFASISSEIRCRRVTSQHEATGAA